MALAERIASTIETARRSDELDEVWAQAIVMVRMHDDHRAGK